MKTFIGHPYIIFRRKCSGTVHVRTITSSRDVYTLMSIRLMTEQRRCRKVYGNPQALGSIHVPSQQIDSVYVPMWRFSQPIANNLPLRCQRLGLSLFCQLIMPHSNVTSHVNHVINPPISEYSCGRDVGAPRANCQANPLKRLVPHTKTERGNSQPGVDSSEAIGLKGSFKGQQETHCPVRKHLVEGNPIVSRLLFILIVCSLVVFL